MYSIIMRRRNKASTKEYEFRYPFWENHTKKGFSLNLSILRPLFPCQLAVIFLFLFVLIRQFFVVFPENKKVFLVQPFHLINSQGINVIRGKIIGLLNEIPSLVNLTVLGFYDDDVLYRI